MTQNTILDSLQRPLRDLRISVTDRCTFRCTYCMPKEVFGRDYVFLSREDLLSFEEIARLTRIFVDLGVRKVRLTGVSPPLRRDFDKLVAMLADIEGLEDIAMTTNGSLLTLDKAKELKAAGLDRVTVSLDSLREEVFQSMNDVGFPVARVLEAINNAEAAGLTPIKVDMVVKRGVNDTDIVDMARHFRGTGHILRFIEYMDVGTTNGWRMEDMVSAKEILEILQREWPLEPVDPNYFGEVAERYRYLDGQGEVGIIASVTRAFCGACTRARLSADGELYTCLFGVKGHDLRKLLRDGSSDEQVAEAVRAIWGIRNDRYSEIRSEDTIGLHKVEMSKIGG